jgi:hypothetical protein
VLALAIVLFTALAALAEPVLADNFAPPSDADLQAIINNTTLAKQHAGACASQPPKEPADCPAKIPCKEADDVAKSLDDSRMLLETIKAALAGAAWDQHMNLESIQNAYAENAQRADKARYALAASKSLTSAAKITLDAASLYDSFNSIKDIVDKVGTGKDLSDLDQAILAAKLSDQMIELPSTLVSTVDDTLTAARGKGFTAKDIADLQTYKGFISDLFGAATDFRDNFNKANPILTNRLGQQMPLRGSPLNVKATSLRAAGKSLGQAIAKVGNFYAERLQGRLQDELIENALVQDALDSNHAAAYRDYARTIDREVAVAHALDAIRDAYLYAYACTGKCGLPYPGGAGGPDTNGMSFGEVLKLYNPQINPAAQKLGAAATNFMPQPCNEKPKDMPVVNKPAEEKKPDCDNTGGLSGNLNNVACQDNGGKQ